MPVIQEKKNLKKFLLVIWRIGLINGLLFVCGCTSAITPSPETRHCTIDTNIPLKVAIIVPKRFENKQIIVEAKNEAKKINFDQSSIEMFENGFNNIFETTKVASSAIENSQLIIYIEGNATINRHYNEFESTVNYKMKLKGQNEITFSESASEQYRPNEFKAGISPMPGTFLPAPPLKVSFSDLSKSFAKAQATAFCHLLEKIKIIDYGCRIFNIETNEEVSTLVTNKQYLVEITCQNMSNNDISNATVSLLSANPEIVVEPKSLYINGLKPNEKFTGSFTLSVSKCYRPEKGLLEVKFPEDIILLKKERIDFNIQRDVSKDLIIIEPEGLETKKSSQVNEKQISIYGIAIDNRGLTEAKIVNIVNDKPQKCNWEDNYTETGANQQTLPCRNFGCEIELSLGENKMLMIIENMGERIKKNYTIQRIPQ